MWSRMKTNLQKTTRHNLATLRSQPFSEISGSLGDLGTFLPIWTVLATMHAVDVPATLLFSGLANIAAGAAFGVPVPVQPMKALAAAAFTSGFRIGETTAAGLVVSAVVFVLAITSLLGRLGHAVPGAIVRGIQLGAGMTLIKSAGGNLGWLWWVRPWWDNYLWVLAVFVTLLIAAAVEKRFALPVALMAFAVGVILAIASPSEEHVPGVGVELPGLHVPLLFTARAMSAAVGQVPLTLLNSVLATRQTSKDLLPELEAPSLTGLGLSLSLANFLSAPFGGMPICHGSGGLAAQVRFGARSGAAPMLLGFFKVLLSLFYASGTYFIVSKFPRGILGILVVVAGVELAGAGVKGYDEGASGAEEKKTQLAVMLVTAAGILAFSNDAVGFCAGLAWHLAVNWGEVRQGVRNWWGRRWWLSRERGGGSENAPLLAGGD